MDMKVLDKINHELWNVLTTYAEGIKSADDVETVKHAISAIFKIRCLEEMEDFKNASHTGYRDGGSYRYYDDRSFARGGRSMTGPQFYRDGGNMRDKLEYLLQDATDERQRQVIREMMNRI